MSSIFVKKTDLKVAHSKPAITSLTAMLAGKLVKDRISESIHDHIAALQSAGIDDLSILGKLSISGNVIPSPGVLKPHAGLASMVGITEKTVAFYGTHRVRRGSVGDTLPLDRTGGNAILLKSEPLPRSFKKHSSAIDRDMLEIESSPLLTPLITPSVRVSALTRKIPTAPLFLARPEIPIPIAYWAASEINIADDTMIILKQPHHWLVMIAEKITFGNNVTFSWEQENKGIPDQEGKLDPLPTPPTSIYMSGTDGADGLNGNPGAKGFMGDDGPEIEIWTLEINRLPGEVLLTGQKGGKGGKGQDGQDGQKGAKGRTWRSGAFGSCSSGPGNGGDGGEGGDGGKGGNGGDGGHGGRFNLFAPEDQLLTVVQQGFYIDVKEGDGGDGGDGGEGGKGGSRGKSGKDRSVIGCPTSFGKNGKQGGDGSKGSDGDKGSNGEHYTDAEQFYIIDRNEFTEAFNKPAIYELSEESARAGDTLSAVGKNFLNTDKIYVNDKEAVTTFVSDTLVTFIVPNVEGGRQKPVYIKQNDGTTSNQATLHIYPEIYWIEQDGKKSTDIPAPRFIPGDPAKIIGSGFSDDLMIRINESYVPEENITYHNNESVTFVVLRPGDVTPNEAGEEVMVEVILADNPQSEQVPIVLDTFVIVVFGDSIQWGQGLREDLKFHSIVENHVSNNRLLGVYKTVHAHSGATIGVGDGHQEVPVHGEVPTSYPTILQQLDLYSGNPALVDLILIDGGINDIGVEDIINPLSNSDLVALTQTHCYDDVIILLNRVIQRFPNAKIILTGYYKAVSKKSDLGLLILFFAGLGMLVGGLVGAIVGGIVSDAQKDKMVSRCRTFTKEANQKLQKAVDDVNTNQGGNPKIFFAKPEFTNENAIFASDSWLWGIEGDLGPADDEEIGGVEQIRNEACELVNSQDSERTDMTICVRASIGHPNVAGAREYARVINNLL
jgi:hypothetical protein